MRCLQGLLEIDRPNLHCIVIDNSPDPDTRELELRFPTVIVRHSGHNAGFAAGCNIGIDHALRNDTDFILLLNPDTHVDDDFVAPLLATMNEGPKIGVCGPTILDETAPNAIQYAGGKVRWYKGGPQHELDPVSKAAPLWTKTSFVTGCAMFLRAATVIETGPMPEGYFLYFEDADYVEQIKSKGWDAAYVPSSRIYHAVSSTTGYQSESYVYHFSRNRIWFLKRWSPFSELVVYLAIHTFIKLPGAIAIFGIKRREWNLVKAFFKGYADALTSKLPKEPLNKP